MEIRISYSDEEGCVAQNREVIIAKLIPNDTSHSSASFEGFPEQFIPDVFPETNRCMGSGEHPTSLNGHFTPSSTTHFLSNFECWKQNYGQTFTHSFDSSGTVISVTSISTEISEKDSDMDRKQRSMKQMISSARKALLGVYRRSQDGHRKNKNKSRPKILQCFSYPGKTADAIVKGCKIILHFSDSIGAFAQMIPAYCRNEKIVKNMPYLLTLIDLSATIYVYIQIRGVQFLVLGKDHFTSEPSNDFLIY